MKAIMSNTLREILRDPQKKEELRKGVSQLHSKVDHSDNTVVCIGGQKYEIEFVSQDVKK